MASEVWTLQDAKNCFSAVVNAAMAGRPQLVTRRGKPATVVLGVEEYERLRRLERSNQPSMVELLLELPQDDGSIERAELEPRHWEE
ncbi:type II toxin-antitoxin system Phd/YefM family antitoxin [Synechococcus sp. CS-602]|uniref:type II toxin-antitoxin system Phd/YefM family antitoxin n=1 Tax=Synechococcaceae TaxID=1890426 RepID=UPI0008FF2F6E|nr:MULTISPECIES: type II toxin-antitoxin system Phd/YefM family antitoxin [Synechococcaceae]MCT4363339.1 type II toxin-antitoxin system Phd/YefM family antitoxin [Candidatus Regnicoccus frigidus MAG-AL1]APD48706.1 prevent-host-death protein [Synechococcus sp. SynAce01]MCT0205224.1 type II toxin-antitoxin system Phd/YefM family antitoxin [Synechococcus sp. CS-602]MCT0245676.1 type II toxin-antitoxin system Phd/YefM family antitoxin [Synechococcus sp. CS-601]MCT4367473.1 type II toxin-antitoxin 